MNRWRTTMASGPPKSCEGDALERLRRGDTSGWYHLALSYVWVGRHREYRKALLRAASAGDPKGWYALAQDAWLDGDLVNASRRLRC